MNTKLMIVASAICLLASCAPTALSTSSVTPAMEIEAKATATPPTPMPTAIPTETVPAAKLFRSEDLPVKNRADLEQYYACNDAERKADRWYGVDPLVKSVGEHFLQKNAFEWVIEVRADNYVVTVPSGAGVVRINFTTKSCDVDWLYVILPRDRDPLDFKIVVEIK